MTAKQAQSAWDALRGERDDLLLAIDRCEETKTALHMNLRAMRDERDELAALVEVMQDSLNVIAMLGTTDGDRRSASAALPPNCIAADILRQRDARVSAQALRNYVETIPGGSIIDPQWVADDMRRTADELERKNG